MLCEQEAAGCRVILRPERLADLRSAPMFGPHPLHIPCRGPLSVWRCPMPALNWFYATTAVLLLCGIAIVTPFLLGMVSA